MQQLQHGAQLRNGEYVIEYVLGQGGFGITYKATKTSTQQQVAIKELFLQGVNERGDDSTTVIISNSDNTTSFAQQRTKFEKEAQRLSELRNKHIVRVYDFFEDNGTAYYVMDYVEGRSLASIIKERPLSEPVAYEYLQQIMDALISIHERHIWHLDIKPANILITPNNQAVLIDFGASKHIDLGGEMTTSSALAYTPGFAPPEQMQGSMKAFGPWTDIYALGGTLYNMLTQSKPPTFADMLSSGNMAFSYPDNISTETRERIAWMMRPNHLERPQTANEIMMMPPSPQTTRVIGDEPTRTVGEMPQPVAATPKKNNGVLYAIIALMVVAFIVVLVLIPKSGQNDVKTHQETATFNTTDELEEAPTEEALVEEIPAEEVPVEEPAKTREDVLNEFRGSYSTVSPGAMKEGISYVYTMELDPVYSSCQWVEDGIVDITNSKGFCGTMMQMPEVWEIITFSLHNSLEYAIVTMKRVDEWYEGVNKVCTLKLTLDEYNNIIMTYVDGNDAPGVLVDSFGGFSDSATFYRE